MRTRLLAFIMLMGDLLIACAPGSVSGAPDITLAPASGGPNTPIVVSGAGFPPATALHVRLGPPSVGATPQSYAETTADAQGEFTLTFLMPGQWPDGTPITEQDLMVIVLNEDGSVKATAPFHLQPELAIQPDLALESRNSASGQQVVVNGYDFPADVQVVLRLGALDSGLSKINLAQVWTGESGTFEVPLTIPTAWPGSGILITEQDLLIAAVDPAVGRALATARFSNPVTSSSSGYRPADQPETGKAGTPPPETETALALTMPEASESTTLTLETETPATLSIPKPGGTDTPAPETAATIALTVPAAGETGALALKTAALITLTISEPLLQVRVPQGYELVKNGEPNRRGSFVSYDFRTGKAQAPYLYEIQFFSEASIRAFTQNCQVPRFFGDYPDPERYHGQKTAFEALSDYKGYRLQQFGKRYYFVSNHRCEGDACVIREYTTFLGDVKVDVWILMQSAAQAAQSDELFSVFEIIP